MFNPDSSLHCSEFAHVSFSEPLQKISLTELMQEPRRSSQDKLKNTVTIIEGREEVTGKRKMQLDKETEELLDKLMDNKLKKNKESP